jgi:CheY-like chemotaxis protein
VDDDQDDLLLISEAFLKYAQKLRVVHAHNGREGWQVLHKMKEERSLPCLVIMDINMPVMNGKEALEKIKSCPEFKDLPIVLFSTSSNERDQQFARKWGADFITKPSNYQDLEGLVKEFVSRCVFNIEQRA